MARFRTARERSRVLYSTHESITTGIAVVAFIAMIFALVSMFIGYLMVDEFDNDQRAPYAVQELFHENHPIQNKQTADAILYLDNLGTDTIITVSDDEDRQAQFRQMIEQVQKTGEYPSVTIENLYFWPMWLGWAWWVLKWLIPLGFAAMFVTYAVYSLEDKHYLTDLDYRSPKTYLLLVATLLPIGWVFYAVSAVRYAAARRDRGGDEPVTTEDAEDDETEDFHYFIDDDYMEVAARREIPEFHHEPGVSRETYVSHRTSVTAKRIEGQLEEVDYEIDRAQEELRRAGELIRSQQQRLGEARAQKRELEAVQACRVDDVEAETANMEFDALLGYAGVKAVRVVNGMLSILVEPVIRYKGTEYDGGSWELIVGDTRLGSRELRSGIKKSWRDEYGIGRYPDYRYHGGTFCFGYRDGEITEHVQKGQYLEAVALAIDCMSSVNSDDKSRIPQAFKKYKGRTVLVS